MKKKIKKEIIGFDENTFCGEMAYGYSNKKEAKKAIEEYTGVTIDEEDMTLNKVMKFTKKDGEEFYSWVDTCECCGRKNNGVFSWCNFG